jgi:hypothetical protein
MNTIEADAISFVIPAKAGIQGGEAPALTLDPRLRGGDVWG